MSSNAQPTPAQQLAEKVDNLQRRVNDLQKEVLLAKVKDEVENLDTLISQLAGQVQALRTSGYVFGKDLESQAASLKAQWPALRVNAQRQITQQTAPLQAALRTLEAQQSNLNLKRNNVPAGNQQATLVAAAVDSLEAKVAAAQTAIQGGYDQFKSQAEAVQRQVAQLKQMLTWLAEAKFALLATEGLYAAVEAKWDRDGKDDPKGLLYLTDQRVLFEQKEEIATKKFLFIATEKEKVQQLVFEVPVTAVDDAKGSKKGLLGHEDHLDLALSAEAPVRAAHFHLNGQDANLWQQMLSRAKARDLDKERAVKVDQAVIDKVAAAPTKCSNCGANFTKPVLRGQTEVTCEFCGTLTRF